MEALHYWLRQRLEEKRSRNASFSLRSYAKQLKISPATLSALMSGKRRLTHDVARKICEQENLSPRESVDFLQKFLLKSKTISVDSSRFELEEEEFRLVSDWYHFAILSMTKLKEHRGTPAWVADYFSLSTKVAREAVARLLRLKLMEKNGKRYQALHNYVKTTTGVPSLAIRKAHSQLLDRARTALELEIDVRDFGANFFAVKKRDLPVLKERIREFRRQLHEEFDSQDADEVYVLQTQFYPLGSDNIN